MRSGNGFTERGESGGGVARGLRTRRSASLPDPHRRAEDVVEIGRALRRGDRVAASDVRLVDEALIATLDEREAVPEEVLGGGGRRGRSPRPTIITANLAVVRPGELAVDVVVVGVGPRALPDEAADARIFACQHTSIHPFAYIAVRLTVFNNILPPFVKFKGLSVFFWANAQMASK